MLPWSCFGKSKFRGESDDSSLLQRHEGTVLIDGLQRAAAQLELHVLAEFFDPDALGLKVWRNGALHHFRDVTTDTAFFLGQAGTVNFSTGADSGSSDAADTGHKIKKGSGLRGAQDARAETQVKTKPEYF